MKVKIKPKHLQIAKHYASCVDRHKYPHFKLTNEVVERFIQFESYGEKDFNQEERASINPLVGESWKFAPDGSMVIDEWGGKGRYELTKKQIHEEIFDWWAKGWGWYYPLASTIGSFFASRHATTNIATKEYIKIFRKIKKGGADNYLLSLKGSIFSESEIQAILNKKF